jgi:hypothetical protein
VSVKPGKDYSDIGHINVQKIFIDSTFFSNIQIVCKTPTGYRFIDGDSGRESAILPDTTSISSIINLNTDFKDDLISIRANQLIIYNLYNNIGVNGTASIPVTFLVSPNYPNPFNASTLIEYGLPESGPVKVEIFDILGRKIQTLVNETQAAGYHQVIWDGKDMPSGTYFYRIQAGDKSQTKKCLLLK